MDLSNILGIAKVGEALPGALSVFRGMTRDPKRIDGAGAVYIAYQTAASEALVHLHYIISIGVPPPVVGGLWTWPQVFRSHRLFVDAVTKQVTAFGQMVLLGNYDVVEAAYSFGMEFSKCTEDLPKVGRRLAMTHEYQERLNKANAELRSFILAARKDLSVPGRITPSDTSEIERT